MRWWSWRSCCSCSSSPHITGCLLRPANHGARPCSTPTCCSSGARLRRRRPIHDKPSGYLCFAALVTKPGEIGGLICESGVRRPRANTRPFATTTQPVRTRLSAIFSNRRKLPLELTPGACGRTSEEYRTPVTVLASLQRCARAIESLVGTDRIISETIVTPERGSRRVSERVVVADSVALDFLSG